MKTSTKIAIVVILILIGVAACQTYRLQRAAKKEYKARVEQTRKDMKAAEFERVATATQAEMAASVEALKDELAAAKKAGARTVLASSFEGKGKTIHVPASHGPASGGAATADSPPGADPPAPSGAAHLDHGCDVDPWVRIAEAIVADDGGGVYLKRKVDVQLTAENWASGWKPVDEIHVDTTGVDPEIEKAIRAYRMPKVMSLPWQVDLHALVSGPDLGARIGGAFYPTGHRMGFMFQYGKEKRSVSGYDPYQESSYSREVNVTEYAVGATWRFGPK